MKTVINDQQIAVFFESYGQIELTADGCWVGIAFNPTLNTSNATVVDIAPPELLYPNMYKLEGGVWVCIDEAQAASIKQQQRDKYNAEQKDKRKAAYADEADPLYFMAQREEATLEEWQAKVAEIKAKFPYKD
jgi:hypothetical protein